MVISGGQTGADLAGWRAAKMAGIPTGGWMPRGFRTEGRVNHAGFLTADESHPEFAEMYGAREHLSPDYPPRTRMNAAWVADEAGGIIVFDGSERMSPGTKLLNGIACDLIARGFSLSILVIKLRRDRGSWRVADEMLSPEYAAMQVRNGQASRLMVAGNRESSSPGIGAWVEAYLAEVFRGVMEGGTR
jgi:hypothetical protein